MPRPSTSFTSLAGVPVRYDRKTSSSYGTRGVEYVFYSDAAFTATLQTCFAELWDVCPLGRAEVITSAGAWVAKPGRHGNGLAFDLDGIFWAGKDFVTLYDGYQGRDRRFYYAVECVLRRHYGQVLNFDYNADHRDHFHVDRAAGVGIRRSSQAFTVFVQGLLRTVFGRTIAVDGVWGDQTESGLRAAAASLGLPALDTVEAWRTFLLGAARTAFGPAADALPAVTAVPAGSPGELLRAVYETVRRELGNTALRKPVESALDAFATHPDTVRWMGDDR